MKITKKNNSFLNLLLLNLLLSVIVVFGLGLIYFYLHTKFTLLQIAFYFITIWVFGLLSAFAIKSTDYARSIRVSLMLRMLMFVLLASVSDPVLLLLIAAIFGATVTLFWIPFNALYFSLANNKNRMLLNSLLVVIIPIANIILLPLTGIIANEQGFVAVFALAAGLSFVTFVFADMNILPKKASVNIGKSLDAIKGTRTLFFLEGFWQSIGWLAIPMVTLTYISSVVDYGTFLAFLVSLSIVGSLIISRISDRVQNRLTLAFPLFILAAVSTMAAGLSSGIEQWTITTALTSLFSTMIAPFMASLIGDTTKEIDKGVYAREVMLNAGRIIGGLVLIAFALYGNLQPALIIAGTVFLAYPFIMRKKLEKTRFYRFSKLGE